jgi:hypothetical protein
MCIPALFIVAERLKQPKCPLVGERINKMWYICAQIYYSALKRKDRQAWWHAPVIPATWDVEIGGSQFKVRQKRLVRPYLKKNKNKNKLGMVVHTYNPTYLESEGRRITV